MSENTYLQAVLRKGKIRNSKQLIAAFLKTLTILGNPNPRVSSLVITTQEGEIKSGGYGAQQPIAKTKEQIKAIIQQEQKKQKNTKFLEIHVYGSIMLDHDKYLLTSEGMGISTARTAIAHTETLDGKWKSKEAQLNEPEIRWSGMNPSYYGLSGEKEYEENYEQDSTLPEFKKRTKPSITEIVTEIHRIAKEIIFEFDPVMFSFCREYGEYLHHSVILYFKDPYLFLIEFLRYGFLVDEGVAKKLQQIKKVLPLKELLGAIEKDAKERGYDLFRTKGGGLGIFITWHNQSERQGYIPVIAELRQRIRERGVELPNQDIEVIADIYKFHEKTGS